MLLALLVIGGALAGHFAARKAQAAGDTQARLQENARYALGVIAQDLRMAGYWGLTNRADLLGINAASAFPTACGATWVTDLAHAVTGHDNSYGLGCAASGGGAVAGADVLVVRHASAQRITPQSSPVASANRTQVLVVTSRTRGEVFVPASIANRLPAGYATSDPPGAPPLADTRQLAVNAYYVSRNSSTATAHPALRRKTLTAGPGIGEEEVLPGIEDLQVQLGVDTDGDGGTDLYADPGAVPAGGTILAARVWLRLRSEDIDPDFTDGRTYRYANRTFTAPPDHRRRLLVAATVQLRNASR